MGAGEGADTIAGSVAWHAGSAEVSIGEAADQALVADAGVALSF